MPEKLSDKTVLGAESRLLDLAAMMRSRVGVDTRRMSEGVADLATPTLPASRLSLAPAPTPCSGPREVEDMSLEMPSKKSAAAVTLVGVWCLDVMEDEDIPDTDMSVLKDDGIADIGTGVDNCDAWDFDGELVSGPWDN